MADTNINDNRNPDSGGSAVTILVTIIIVVIIGLAFWFGYGRSHWGSAAPIPAGDNGGLNIDVSGTFPSGSGQDGGPAE
jgi:hypothetical protein